VASSAINCSGPKSKAPLRLPPAIWTWAPSPLVVENMETKLRLTILYFQVMGDPRRGRWTCPTFFQTATRWKLEASPKNSAFSSSNGHPTPQFFNMNAGRSPITIFPPKSSLERSSFNGAKISTWSHDEIFPARVLLILDHVGKFVYKHSGHHPTPSWSSRNKTNDFLKEKHQATCFVLCINWF
jgi:hypothetical protein